MFFQEPSRNVWGHQPVPCERALEIALCQDQVLCIKTLL